MSRAGTRWAVTLRPTSAAGGFTARVSRYSRDGFEGTGRMIGSPTYEVALPSLNGPLAGPAFIVAVIGIGVLANVAYAGTTPFAAGQPLERLERRPVAKVAFGLWTALGCLAVVVVRALAGVVVYDTDGQAIGPVGVPEPGGVIFALTCAAWTAPFVTIAWRRRRPAWIALAAIAVVAATGAAVNLWVRAPGTIYDPTPPALLILAIVAVGVWAAILYGIDTIPVPGRWARAVFGQAFLVAWALIGLTGMTLTLAWSKDLADGAKQPAGMLFAAASVFWTLPYLVLASRRRTPTWIIVGLASIVIAVFGIVYVFINPTPCGCD
jgi:hypothetical protein